MKPMQSLASILLMGAFLSSCALSPQSVHLDPDIKVTSKLSANPPVALEIEDARPENSIGRRGGIYDDSSHILPAAPLAKSLRPAASEALERMGVRLSEQAPTRLILRVERLDYEADGKVTPIRVQLEAGIQVRALRGEDRFSGRYESSQEHQFLKRPSEEDNARIINEVLANTLSRALADPGLRAFLGDS